MLRVDQPIASDPACPAAPARLAIPPAWLSSLASFVATSLVVLPVEYRMAAETALIALFPRHF